MTALTKTCPQCGETYDFEQRFCPKDGSTLRAPAGSNLVGSVLADRYHIVRRIGEGGMGQVYLAEHVKMKRRSAVKVLHQGMVNDPDAIARFNREASNASQIQHPNVAAIYDFGETDDGLIYLAMEFVDGEPLTKVIEREGALPAVRAAEITRQVADALSAAHDLGIIHRDLKPDNIMVARSRSGEDVAKVVDFGIAKATSGEDQKVTRTGLAIGTPEYMSPEQLSGDTLDARTDIYSLGLVAFNMLTGTLPFPTVSSREALIARLTEKPHTLAEMRGDIAWPTELQTVLDRALATHPAERYEHATQFARDLGRAVANMPQSAFTSTGTVSFTKTTVPPTTRQDAVRPDAPTPPAGTARQSPSRPARRPTPLIAGEAATGGASNTGRGVLIAFISLVVIVGGGAGFYFWRASQQAAPPAAAQTPPAATTAPQTGSASGASLTSAPATPAAASADSTRHDSAQTAAPPESAATAANDSVTHGNSTRTDSTAQTRTHVTEPPSNLDDLLAPITQDIAVGRSRMGDGEYEGARVRFGQAEASLRDIDRKYPGLPQVRALKADLAKARDANRDACRAERELDQKRGQPGPDCP